MDDITGLHHVGHVVRDLDQATRTYRRLGFTVAPPAYPVLPDAEPAGVANAHVYFPGGFVELVAVFGPGGPPAGARPIPLRVPADRREALTAAVRAAAANIASFLDRYEGVHILMVDTPDLDGVAARLTAAGVGHGGVHDIRRPVETGAGTRMEPARYLEIAAREGRVGFARNVTTPDDLSGTDHPNGATGLTECVLAAEDAALPGLARRYAAYFGDGHEDGQLVRYERAGVVVAGASALGGLLPGERVSGPPGFVAYTISVRDVAATERLLRRDGVPARRTGAAELLVPARAALGAAIVFRQYG